MQQTSLTLSVVTPERALATNVAVDAIVLPAEGGQLTLLPGHINFVTSLGRGAFGYQTGGEWQVAFLAGGFAQVFSGKVTVMAETMEMAEEVDIAGAEMKLQETVNKIKGLKVGSLEYAGLEEQKALLQHRIKAAQKKLR